MNGSRSIAGKVAVVTGAASGMGRAIADVFLEDGAVVAALDRDHTGVVGVGTAQWTLDVSDGAAIDRVVHEIVDRLGPADILVNCAGVSLPAPLEADDYWRAWETTMAVNLAAYVRMIRACLP